MIFLDTSAIYALADSNDPFHRTVRERFQALLDADEQILTHNYVLVEAIALLQTRLGRAVALKFANDARAFEIDWVDQATHEGAIDDLARREGRRVSLVDQVSFIVMRRRRVRTALAVDSDFEREGFRLL